MSAAIDVLANNGTVGGGEVMMVAFADAVRAAGLSVRVVTPTEPSGARELAESHNLDVLTIPAVDRRSYLTNLSLQRHRLDSDVWWCNGLVPALATAGTRHHRIVHLHQAPTGKKQALWQLARVGARGVVVPSQSMRQRVPGARVLLNWTDDAGAVSRPTTDSKAPFRIGFIGRFSTIKGLDVLARAVRRLQATSDRSIELVLAGDGRFVAGSEGDTVALELERLDCVTCLGWVERSTFYDSVDLVVVPSVWPEPFGLVAAEAMAYGRPVVVSDAGALGEVVGPRHPWVTVAGDVADTARVIARVIDADEDELVDQTALARRRWETLFSPQAGHRRVASLLDELRLR